MRRLGPFLVVLALTGVVSAAAPAERERAWVQGAKVLRVVSGDTLDVRLATGQRERVRLLGVRAPAAGDCFAAQARTATRGLVGGQRVTLRADRSRATRDGKRRLLAYVGGGGGDVGGTLLARGLAQVDVESQEFGRFLSYVPVQRLAEHRGRGFWRQCAADVAVDIVPSAEQAIVGERVTYDVGLINHGPLAAPNIVLELRPPLTARIVSVESGAGPCRIQDWLATCTFRTLGYDKTVHATLEVEHRRAGPASVRAAARFDWCVRASCGSAPLVDRGPRNSERAALTTVLAEAPQPGAPRVAGCHPSYPTACIPYPPPDLACADIPHRDFHVRRDIPDADPHSFDGNEDGIGCQFDDY